MLFQLLFKVLLQFFMNLLPEAKGNGKEQQVKTRYECKPNITFMAILIDEQGNANTEENDKKKGNQQEQSK